MTTPPPIPVEIVELAAHALAGFTEVDWATEMDEEDRESARTGARAALEAAAPFLFRTWVSAKLREVAQQVHDEGALATWTALDVEMLLVGHAAGAEYDRPAGGAQ